MNSEELKTLAIRLAALTDLLEDRSRQCVFEVSQSSDRLTQAAQGLGLAGQQLARETVSTIGAHAQEVIRRGLKQALDQCSHELQQTARQATQTAANLHEQRAALQRTQRGLIWKAGLALLVGAVLAAGGSGYLVWKSLEAARQADFSTAIVRATHSGALTQCGGVLCIKTGKNMVRYDKNGDYILLKE
ncbi:hypothetical protein [Variovorax paradoxus]|uniref:hypothetical protein n=1 Tax=Variovorax paradoxus TaxID=34073 RepID=UPI003D6514F5